MYLAHAIAITASEPLKSSTMFNLIELTLPLRQLIQQQQGFIWQLNFDNSDRDSHLLIAPNEILVSLTVWQNLENFQQFEDQMATFKKTLIKTNSQLSCEQHTLWWVEAAHHPTPLEAKQRFEHYQECGNTAIAFTDERLFDHLTLMDPTL